MLPYLLKMHRKKSQIKMLETTAVLAVFFVIVMLAYAFYSRMLESGIDAENEESLQLNAVKTALRSSSLPELQCSQENIIIGNCIDIMKLEAIPHIINENEAYYFDRLSFSRIIAIKIYPDEGAWVIYDNPLKEYSSKDIINMPLVLWDSVGDKNAFGIMSIEAFSK